VDHQVALHATLFYRFSGAPGVAKSSKVEISRTALARLAAASGEAGSAVSDLTAPEMASASLPSGHLSRGASEGGCNCRQLAQGRGLISAILKLRWRSRPSGHPSTMSTACSTFALSWGRRGRAGRMAVP
jgi:hypothetical protein